jgi:hypothetical protein
MIFEVKFGDGGIPIVVGQGLSHETGVLEI